jgi:hypothetical protein
LLSDLYLNISKGTLDVAFKTVETKDGPAYFFLNSGIATNDPFVARELSGVERKLWWQSAAQDTLRMPWLSDLELTTMFTLYSSFQDSAQ